MFHPDEDAQQPAAPLIGLVLAGAEDAPACTGGACSWSPDV
jgi:hypothetical protein